MSDRILKINELLREKVARVILEQMEFPDGTIASVLSVRTSPDLRYAKVFISVIPDEQADFVVKRLNNSSKMLQSYLADEIEMKFTPKLSFALDDTERHASEIDELLDNLKY